MHFIFKSTVSVLLALGMTAAVIVPAFAQESVLTETGTEAEFSQTTEEVPDSVQASPEAWGTLKSVHWDLGSLFQDGKTFPFYENATQQKKNNPARYWYAPTSANPKLIYAYHTQPLSVRDRCEIHVTSSDSRVMKVDEATKSLIPVGNGEATLTITATMNDNGKQIVQSDTTRIAVKGSPYTPVSGVQIALNTKKSSDTDYKVETATQLVMRQGKAIWLGAIAPAGSQGSFDHKRMELTLEDGRKVCIFDAPAISWSSADSRVVRVDSDGKVSAVGPGETTVTLRVTDNGAGPYTHTITIRTQTSFGQALIGLLMSLVKFNFPMVWRYGKALLHALVG